jgi:hypothetical protein
MTTDAEALRARLLEAATMVGTAKSLIADGGIVDLSGLDARVQNICKAIPALASGERDELKPALIALMDGLGGLAETVKAQHAMLAEKLSNVSQGRRAIGAYGAGLAAGRKPPKTR